MRVLHVIPSVSPLRGGPSVMVRTMTRGLVSAGVEVDIATTDDDGPGRLPVTLSEPVIRDGVTYWYFPRQTEFYTFSWPLTRWLAQHVRKYDLVHIHALFSYTVLPAAYWARRYKIPYIVKPLGILNRWGVNNRRPYLKKLSFALFEKRILSNAAAIHFTSEQERLEAADIGVRGRAVIIPNAVDTCSDVGPDLRRFRANSPNINNCQMILFLARIDEKKGLDILLPAFAEIQKTRPNAVLVIAGNGKRELLSRLRQQAERLEI